MTEAYKKRLVTTAKQIRESYKNLLVSVEEKEIRQTVQFIADFNRLMGLIAALDDEPPKEQ